jgi:membrane-bound lytic murein transglycosylase D
VASVATVRAASTGPAPVHAAKAATNIRWYVVKAGDTLYGIARRFDTAVETLRSLNRLSVHGILTPGVKLRVPQLD